MFEKMSIVLTKAEIDLSELGQSETKIVLLGKSNELPS